VQVVGEVMQLSYALLSSMVTPPTDRASHEVSTSRSNSTRTHTLVLIVVFPG
jgi:hypothetical protein